MFSAHAGGGKQCYGGRMPAYVLQPPPCHILKSCSTYTRTRNRSNIVGVKSLAKDREMRRIGKRGAQCRYADYCIDPGVSCFVRTVMFGTCSDWSEARAKLRPMDEFGGCRLAGASMDERKTRLAVIRGCFAYQPA